MIPPPRRQTVIATPRLFLKPPAANDYLAWRSLRAESRPFLEPWEPAWPPDALSRSDWRRHLESWRRGWGEGRAFVLFLWRAADEALVGGVSLANVRYGSALSATMGYWLGEPHEGRGYMREAVFALCDWAFRRLELERIEAGTLPENDRSRRLLHSVGFAEEGVMRSYLQIAGRRRDHILYGLPRGVEPSSKDD